MYAVQFSGCFHRWGIDTADTSNAFFEAAYLKMPPQLLPLGLQVLIVKPASENVNYATFQSLIFRLRPSPLLSLSSYANLE